MARQTASKTLPDTGHLGETNHGPWTGAKRALGNDASAPPSVLVGHLDWIPSIEPRIHPRWKWFGEGRFGADFGAVARCVGSDSRNRMDFVATKRESQNFPECLTTFNVRH